MSQAQMQYSFHAGELTPALNARVDIAKYKAGAALMRNFYPDYRGGASSRCGTRYILRSKGNAPPRLVPFQQSATGNGNYCLEFGDRYIRFFNKGAPILEPTAALTSISNAALAVATFTATPSYAVGDWIYVDNVLGTLSMNRRFYIIKNQLTPTTYTLTNLYGEDLDTTAYGAMTGGTAQRVYTIASPYAIADLPLLKFAQNTNTLLITHTGYSPRLLQQLAANVWVLAPLIISTTLSAPVPGAPASTLAAGTVTYSYVVTSVDSGGQESLMSTAIQLVNLQDIRAVAGTNLLSWTPALGAVSYNVYRAELSYAGAVAGVAYGFIGNATGVGFTDSNIAPDFAQTPPIPQNPFLGGSVISYTITGAGAYVNAPTVNVGAPDVPGGQQASGEALITLAAAAIVNGGIFYTVGQVVTLVSPTDPTTPIGQIRVTATTGAGVISACVPLPSILWGPGVLLPSGAGSLSDTFGTGLLITPAYSVWAVAAISVGSGYLAPPAVTFVPGGATASAVLSTGPSTGNPGVATYFQQRLVMAAPASNPQEFNMSQTGAYFNFNISNPIGAADAIQGSLVSSQINQIKSLAPMSTGLVVFTDKAAWLMNGGSIGSPVSPTTIVATQHSYIGANDMPPIVINYDVLYVQAKGSVVRDLTYNFYAQIYTGTDVSILSSHLFFNHQMKEWAYAEEPFKIIWIVRDDGALLSLTYLKEQEIIGWAHHDTQGDFKSVCTISEPSPLFPNVFNPDSGTTFVDAIYVVVHRNINAQNVYYIERMMERVFNTSLQPTSKALLAWCVDAGGQGSSTLFPVPTQTVVLDHLKGQNVVGLADGVPFTATVSTGSVPSISKLGNLITVGLPFVPQLQTLQLDTGEPTTQGKRKKITAVTVRVQDTLGLSIGKNFSSLVPMKDLVKGNLNNMSNTVVTDLFTGDARTIIDPSWDVPGQYCIQQSNPLPATILGVIPEIVVGDTPPSNK